MAFLRVTYIGLLLQCILLIATPWNVAAEHLEQSLNDNQEFQKNQHSINEPLFNVSDTEPYNHHPGSSAEDVLVSANDKSPKPVTPPPPPSNTFTCTTQCPSCPSWPPAQTCPSPCPNIPECPVHECPVQECPAPCAACPACPQCEKRIPPGYEFFPGLGYYRLHNIPTTWMEAKAVCEREGAHLAILNSQAEADLMVSLYNRDPDIGVVLHLGFHDLYVANRWVTLFGQPLEDTGFPVWSPGQPDYPQERCGSMFINGLLNNVECINPQPFVCEWPI